MEIGEATHLHGPNALPNQQCHNAKDSL